MKKILIPVIIALVIGLLALVKFLAGRNEVIPSNDPSLVGNTAGNLYNGGTFCESDDIVYFANAYDDGALYSMNPDQTKIKKLTGGSYSYINAGGDYLYLFSAKSGGQSGLGYVRNSRGVYRVNKQGKQSTSLLYLTTDGMVLAGDRLVFSNFQEGADSDNAMVTLDSININGEDQVSMGAIHPKVACISGGQLYFAGTDGDHALYAVDPRGGKPTKSVDLNLYLPIVQGGKVFYLDVGDDYHLKSYNMGDGSVTELVAERLDTYNLYGDLIYYQTVDPNGGDGYALKRIRTDGSGMEVVKTGVFRDIQITSNYTYFREFGNDLPVYCTPTYGSVNVQNFNAAMEAATQK